MIWLSPDCRDNNHQKCDGLAWDDELDETTACHCTDCDCYDRNWDDPFKTWTSQ